LAIRLRGILALGVSDISTSAPSSVNGFSAELAGPSSGRRFGAENSATRAALIDAGIDLLQEEGSAALTARRVAERAGLKPQLVHYYFHTIEDLIIAIVRHAGREDLKRMVRAAASEQPLRDLWNSWKVGSGAVLAAEVKALAQHSAAIRAEAVRMIEQHRLLISEALSRHFEVLREQGVEEGGSPVVVAIIIDALTRLFSDEKALGITLGHDEFETAIETWLAGFYGPAKQSPARTG
jgi:AcrR family transcriptional regulator